MALVGRSTPANAGHTQDAASTPGSGRFPGGGRGNPLQYSFLEKPLDRGACVAIVHRVSKSRTRLKRLSMPTGCPQKDPQGPLGEGNGNPLQYSAWRIPWTEGPGGLRSLGSQRVVTSEATEHRGLWGLPSSPTPLEALESCCSFL